MPNHLSSSTETTPRPTARTMMASQTNRFNPPARGGSVTGSLLARVGGGGVGRGGLLGLEFRPPAETHFPDGEGADGYGAVASYCTDSASVAAGDGVGAVAPGVGRRTPLAGVTRSTF